MTRFLPILFLLFSLVVTRAEEMALPKCPSGKFAAVMAFSDDPDDSKIIFRLVGTSKTVGAFGLGGCSKYAELLWSPDSRFAAVQTHFTRHTMELSVFEVSENGIKQAKLQDYTQTIYGRLDILHGGRGQADVSLKWLDKDRLLIEAAGTIGKGDDADYRYRIELRVVSDADEIVGWLEKIEKAVESPPTPVPPPGSSRSGARS